MSYAHQGRSDEPVYWTILGLVSFLLCSRSEVATDALKKLLSVAGAFLSLKVSETILQIANVPVACLIDGLTGPPESLINVWSVDESAD